jgi:hypothetical protein
MHAAVCDPVSSKSLQVNVGGTYFEVPEHYTDLKSIGSGGYGAVWYVKEIGSQL